MAGILLWWSTQAANAAGAGVSIQNRAYAPQVVTVTVGATVTWTNRDGQAHAITARDRSWDSGSIAFGSSYHRTFAEAGTFDYFCQFHPTEMTGTVVVANDPAPRNVVSIQNFAFDPDIITVTTGTTVTWRNLDRAGHTTDSVADHWHSPFLLEGETYSRRFATPGTYVYQCDVHPPPEMRRATIVVTGEVATGSAVYLPLITRSRAMDW